ncbi:MAG: N-acetylmuramoyl-L-alanine amidase [Flavobacterium sp.]|uniref:N-acetylmuramoyl-L-alanine amidase family protein n=1 Tax=Flavobacterium sp. TaxID=239 RepID=UPI001223D3AF|nr:N-acetylmuramoyl-L-alanine amidase [Flavobacterium sp.]RZJ67823.1 MAG: N-acetylmuramoyl-L-alanine amidase [Flavobacterium sp.]
MKNKFKVLIATAALASFAFVVPAKNSGDKLVIVIDAGHGGKDFGATHDAISEKMITEQISKKIKALNKNANVEIHLTRDSDTFTELKDRTQMINALHPDVVLSLHVEANPSEFKSGVGMYVGKDNVEKQKSFSLAGKLGEKLSEKHSFEIGRIQEAPFYILKNSNAPTVLLELGYITNYNDRKYLTSDQEQQKIATTILEWINEVK